MGNDLKTALVRQEFFDSAWWGNLENLEGFSTPEANLREAQIACLKNSSNVHTEEANAMLMKFRTAMEQLNPEVQHQQTVVAIEQSIDKALLKLLNAGLAGHKDNMTMTHLSGKNTEEQARRITNNISMASTLLQKLTAQLGQQISVADLQTFATTMRNAYSLIDPNGGRQWDYTKAKAAAAEDLVTMLINGMPEYQAFTTGAWEDARGKQLIEDNFVIPTSELTKSLGGGLTLTMKIKSDSGSTQYRTRTIHNLQELTTISVPIQLSDELYEHLQKIKAFSIQVKSGLGGKFDKNTLKDTRGIGQGLLNTSNDNQRNKVSLNEVGGLPGLENLIGDMQKAPDYFNIGARSKTIRALANYQLSTHILNTMLRANEIYYTIYGFTTAAEWMEQSKQFVQFASPISFDHDVLNEKRALMFALESANM